MKKIIAGLGALAGLDALKAETVTIDQVKKQETATAIKLLEMPMLAAGYDAGTPPKEYGMHYRKRRGKRKGWMK